MATISVLFIKFVIVYTRLLFCFIMFKLRIGLFLYQHKLCIRSTASILKIHNFSSSSKVACTSLLANHRLRTNSPVLIQSRTFWETFPVPGRSFHDKDELDKKNYELVYRSKLYNYVFYGQLVSELTLAVQIGYGFYLALNYFLLGRIVPLITQIGPFSVGYDLISLGVLTFFTIQNAVIFMSAQKGLLRVYHKKDTDEYVFITLSINPFKTRKVVCKPGELKSLHIFNLKAFLVGNFEINDRRYFLRHEHFKNNYHYNRLVYEDY